MEMMLWNAILSLLVAVMGLMFKGKMEELNRISVLLNRTREEVARDHITRAEVHRDLEKLMERFDTGIQRLETKIDRLVGSN
jgi:hypothetical protein